MAFGRQRRHLVHQHGFAAQFGRQRHCHRPPESGHHVHRYRRPGRGRHVFHWRIENSRRRADVEHHGPDHDGGFEPSGHRFGHPPHPNPNGGSHHAQRYFPHYGRRNYLVSGARRHLPDRAKRARKRPPALRQHLQQHAHFPLHGLWRHLVHGDHRIAHLQLHSLGNRHHRGRYQLRVCGLQCQQLRLAGGLPLHRPRGELDTSKRTHQPQLTGLGRERNGYRWPRMVRFGHCRISG